MTLHYPAPHQLLSTKATRVTQCNEKLNVQFIHCCLHRESQQIPTYIQAYMQVGCYKCSFQNYEIPGHVKVAEHSFGSSWVYVICQIMAREGLLSSQAETWQVKNTLMKDFDWQVKVDIFVVSMATWMIEYNLKISLLLSLQKTHSLDFPINLHIANYN